MVESESERNGPVSQPRQLDDKRRIPLEDIIHMVAQKLPPLLNKPRGPLEVGSGTTRNGFHKKHTLVPAHHLEPAGPIRKLLDPTRERVVLDQGPGQGVLDTGRKGPAIESRRGRRRRVEDEKVFDGESEEELRIQGGE